MEKVLAQGEAWAQARCAGRASTSYCQRHSALHTDSTKWTYREALKLRRVDASIRQCKRHVVRAAAPEQAETSLESIATTEDSLAQPEKIRRMPGRQTYKPASFQVLVQDATNAVKAAVADGLTRLEVEFPALPGNIDGKRWLYVQIQIFYSFTRHQGLTPCLLMQGIRGLQTGSSTQTYSWPLQLLRW